MKVSVIIPTYNEAQDIVNCLESLFEQSEKEKEIIVVDDGSVDQTSEVVKNIQNLHANLYLLNQNHKGAGAARNLGSKKAKGDVLVFVDADMTFDKNFLKNLVKPIMEKEVIGTFSKDEYLLNQENVWARFWNINRGFPENRMHIKNYPDTQKVFRAIRKADFLNAGGFNEKGGYTDDWSISEKLGVEAVVAPNAVFYHKNPDSLSEVFKQSKWMSKRKYKFGTLGVFFALCRVSLPVSIVVGAVKSIEISNPLFFIFKIISDLGQFIGILEYSLFRKVSK